MIDYKTFKNNGIVIKSIKKKNSSFIISDGLNKYVVKKSSSNLDSIYNYLLSRNFSYFPKYFLIKDYYVFEYIRDSNISMEERILEMINLISILHTKTTRYIKACLDDYKIIYDDFQSRINELYNYYICLNDSIDSEIYMSPSHYFLAVNISKIYDAMSFCLRELEKWYGIVEYSEKKRVVFLHNNLDLSHVLIDKKPYLISFDKSKVDIPIYDLIKLYEKYYDSCDFSILLNQYQSRYPLLKDELILFFIMISIPYKIEFTDDEINNVKKVKELINYIENGNKIIKLQYEKEKK